MHAVLPDWPCHREGLPKLTMLTVLPVLALPSGGFVKVNNAYCLAYIGLAIRRVCQKLTMPTVLPDLALPSGGFAKVNMTYCLA